MNKKIYFKIFPDTYTNSFIIESVQSSGFNISNIFNDGFYINVSNNKDLYTDEYIVAISLGKKYNHNGDYINIKYDVCDIFSILSLNNYEILNDIFNDLDIYIIEYHDNNVVTLKVPDMMNIIFNNVDFLMCELLRLKKIINMIIYNNHITCTYYFNNNINKQFCNNDMCFTHKISNILNNFGYFEIKTDIFVKDGDISIINGMYKNMYVRNSLYISYISFMMKNNKFHTIFSRYFEIDYVFMMNNQEEIRILFTSNIDDFDNLISTMFYILYYAGYCHFLVKIEETQKSNFSVLTYNVLLLLNNDYIKIANIYIVDPTLLINFTKKSIVVFEMSIFSLYNKYKHNYFSYKKHVDITLLTERWIFSEVNQLHNLYLQYLKIYGNCYLNVIDRHKDYTTYRIYYE